MKLANESPHIRQFLFNEDEKKTRLRKIKERELKLGALIVEHQLPFMIMDHLPKLITSIDPNSEVTKII